MAQADGNRTRFFSLGQKIQGDNTSINETSSSSMLLVSNAATGGLVTRTSSAGSEDDIIAQRTRMVETETLFKPRKDRNGKLNLSALVKGSNNKPRDSMPTATITEVIEENSETSQSNLLLGDNNDDTTSFFSNAKINPSFVTSHHRSHLNAQAASFVPPPPKLNIFKVSESTVENPVNQQALNLKHLSRSADHLTSDEMLMLSGDQLQVDYFQPRDIPTNLRAIGAKKNTMIGNVNRTLVKKDTTIIPYKNHMNGEKRGTDSREPEDSDQVADGPPITKKPRTIITNNNNNNGIIGPASDGSRDPNLLQPASPFRPNEQETSIANYPTSSLATTVLGHDIEGYITSHMDAYERAKARWTECSREEWERGAEEIVEKFTKILDFVKDHMRRKIALYASLQAKLDGHQKERDNIDKMLKDAKDELVAKTGVLIEEGKLG